MLDGIYSLEVNNCPYDTALEIDIVFIHGLSTESEKAWYNSEHDLWPLWVRQAHPNCRVLLINYPSTKFFGSKSSNVTIRERARNMADLMPAIGIGLRPTIFICHSFGGILIKEVIRSCVETGCSLSIAANTISIIFLATPHLGSNVASHGRAVGSAITKDLMKNSPYLIDLRKWFSEFVKSTRLFISSYYEGYPWNHLIIVDAESSDPACENCIAVCVDYDHFNIAEPKSPNSDIFLRINRDIKFSIKKLNDMTEYLNSIEDITALPEITNHMYFKIVDYLNRLFYANGRGQRAYLISNPCGTSKPSCVIISKDISLLELISPLQKRWPERFDIQNGVLGEFTEEYVDDGDLEKEQGLIKIKSHNDKIKSYLSLVNKFAKIMTNYISKMDIDINIGGFWLEGDSLKIITTVHGFFNTIKKECENVLYNDKRIDVDDKIRNCYKNSGVDVFISSSSYSSYKEEFLSDVINKVYKNNVFKVRFMNNWMMGDSNNSKSYYCEIDNIDYSKDLVVFLVNTSSRSNSGIKSWVRINNSLNLNKDNFRKKAKIQKGEYCFYSSNKSSFIVENDNERGLFPLSDRIVSISSMMVLSGINSGVDYGDSGKPITDDQGNIVAVVIGRPANAKNEKILAMSIIDIIENIAFFKKQGALNKGIEQGDLP